MWHTYACILCVLRPLNNYALVAIMLPGALRFYHHSLTESELVGEMADPLGQGKYESGISCNQELKTKLQTSIRQKDIPGAGEMTEQ